MSKYDPIDTVKQILEPLLIDDIFLVDFKVKPVNNIKIYLDADTGLGIEKCIKINRRLYRQIEEMELYPEGNFSLEVSSPGLDSPLKLHRQYLKNIGRDLEVEMLDESKILGTLIAADEEKIVLSITTGKGKKEVTEQKEIQFLEIKQALVQIKF